MLSVADLAVKVLEAIADMHEIERPKLVPSEATLESVIEAIFWSSLDKYEDIPLRARVYLAPLAALTTSYPNIVPLDSVVPATHAHIRRLAPSHGKHGGLVIIEKTGKPEIAAIYASYRSTEPTHPGWLCIECTGTGVVRVINNHRVLLEYSRGTVSAAGGISFDEGVASLVLSRSLRSNETEAAFTHALQVSELYLTIARSIERNGAGGALWILPTTSSTMQQVDQLGGYRIKMHTDWAEPFREEWELRTSMMRVLNPPITTLPIMEEVQWMAQEWDRGRKAAVCTYIADLARVDGAILATVAPDVRAFGVVCNEFQTRADHVMKVSNPAKPFDGGTKVLPADFGGSRHRSAIDFCSSFAPAGAIVVSHDGGITVFGSEKRGEVLGMKISGVSSAARDSSDSEK
ncbi:MAG TPA: hypothetical protein VFW53_10840 [Gallionella sp.]|nr:hypothetical protein [Gallionella sp.]